MGIYDFSYTSMEGRAVPLSEYEGKVLVIANTASKCGFTPQYEGLEALYARYADDGLVVIGFPCGQFGGQEFFDDHEISEFCRLRYGVTFPLSQKVDVRGETAIPLFVYLTAQKGFEGFGEGPTHEKMTGRIQKLYGDSWADEQIKWNFTKFLIDKKGEVVARYEPTVDPELMEDDIIAALHDEL